MLNADLGTNKATTIRIKVFLGKDSLKIKIKDLEFSRWEGGFCILFQIFFFKDSVFVLIHPEMQKNVCGGVVSPKLSSIT